MRPKHTIPLHWDLLTAARARAGSHNGDRVQDRRKESGLREEGGPHWGVGLVPGKLLLVFTLQKSVGSIS